MATRSKTFGPPVVRTLKTILEGPFPENAPVALHLSEAEWKKISRSARIVRNRVRKGEKGLLMIPDPFGGFFGFLVCASQSKAGVACLPEIVGTPGGGITFGTGCFCARGEDSTDRLSATEPNPCHMEIGGRGSKWCTGNCPGRRPGGGSTCDFVQKPTTNGRIFLTCACS